MRDVKESPKRAEAARKLVEGVGGKMQLFYTFGEYDVVAITEAKDDETAFRVALELGRQGNVRTTTLRAWTPEEAAKVIEKLR